MKDEIIICVIKDYIIYCLLCLFWDIVEFNTLLMDFIIKNEEHKEKVISYLKRLPEREKGYKMRIEKIGYQRSNQQSRYMHFIFNLIAEECGEEMSAVKWYYRKKYLTIIDEIFGEEIERVKSTTELNTIEQEDFMTKVRTHASTERNVFCPLPNEVIYEDI